MQKLIDHIAECFGLTYQDLVGDSRRRHIVEARQAAAWVLRRACPAVSLEAIGDALGGRDHTTIIHSIRVVEARLRADPALAALLREIAGEGAPVPRRRRTSERGMRWWANASRESYLVSAA